MSAEGPGSSSASEESVVVGVRVRPFNQREIGLGAETCIRMEGPSTIVEHKGEQRFTFDESFWSHDGFDDDGTGFKVPSPGSNYADQRYVFEKFGQRVLNNAWDGFHCCLFAYGQTGAGKSYSMVGDPHNKGIVPITCEEIFNRIEGSTDPEKRYEVTVSMSELYNEQVQDLLVLPQDRPKGGLEIRESKMLGIYIDGVSKRAVQAYEEIEAVITEGTSNRTVGSTLMNATSSRAHTVQTIEFKQCEKIAGKDSVKVSMIHLVDLAGSEKAGQTGASGDRLKEGCAINKSLTALGNVIEKLAEKSQAKGKKKDNVLIPYRDSKLTRLLQNALGGSSKTIMVCAVSPASTNAEETLSTLRYADRAKKIKNNAVVNENPQDKLIRELKEENTKFKEMMEVMEKLGFSNLDEVKQKELELNNAQEALDGMQKPFEAKVQESRQVTRDRQEQRRTSVGLSRLTDSSPMMMNLNADMQLNGKVRYMFAEGTKQCIGQPGGMDSDDEDSDGEGSSSEDSSREDNKSAASEDEKPPEITMLGEDIYHRHATVTNVGGKCYLFSQGGAAKATFVNGVRFSKLWLAEQREKKKKSLQQEGGCESEDAPHAGDTTSGILLKHKDRLAFGGTSSRCIFVYVVPTEGLPEMLLLSQEVTYSKARKELRENTQEGDSSDDNGGELKGKALQELTEAQEKMEKELAEEKRRAADAIAEKDSEIAKLQLELAEARQNAACDLEFAKPAYQDVRGARKESVSCAKNSLKMGLVAEQRLRCIFEDAIGALDEVQASLTATRGVRKLEHLPAAT